ncbi:MAG TPA: phytanoyl-CoA dioxygenase family protein [Candidatus Nitrosopolaris sp.]|nr:phytanoyl-CoA dioxygenase family protein [Candidatus Nitrosopolaris sp.]
MLDVTARDLAAIDEHGFVVIPGLLSPPVLDTMRALLRPHLAADFLGRNDFEGHRTQRIYALVGLHKVFQDLVEHPRILAICDALLEPNYLLTASQAINILMGETPQAFHTDDLFYRIARPRKAVSVSTIWAVDPFITENGATQIVPGSHRWSDATIGSLLQEIDFETIDAGARVPRPAPPLPEVLRGQVRNVTMEAGSVIVFLGTLVHRGGENRSRAARLALSNQYCEPWARQQENYTLAIAPAAARGMSPRVQDLLGYSIHPPFMGHVRGRHPRRLMEEGEE